VESEWLGLIEMSVVLMFALGWGWLELYTLKLDRRRDEEKQRAAAEEGAAKAADGASRR
jgi:hypothetical protein